jgi:hypothetical protein
MIAYTKAPASPFESSRARGRCRRSRGVERGRKRPHCGPEPLHELVIFADSTTLLEDYSSLHQNGGRGIRFHRAYSQENQDAIQAFAATAQLLSAGTTFVSYDYKSKKGQRAQDLWDYDAAGKAGLVALGWNAKMRHGKSEEVDRADIVFGTPDGGPKWNTKEEFFKAFDFDPTAATAYPAQKGKGG